MQLTKILAMLALLAVALPQLMVAEDVEISAGAAKVKAQFPDDVSIIFGTPEDKPVSYEGSRGHEDIGIGTKGNMDAYTLEVITGERAKKYGLSSAPSSIDELMNAAIASLGRNFDVSVKDELPEELKTDGGNTRYVWVSALKKGSKDSPSYFLWRIDLVGEQVIVAQRAIGAGYVKEHKVDGKNADEWKFLRSVNVSAPAD